MIQRLLNLLTLGISIYALFSCQIKEPDYFVPEVTTPDGAKVPLAFLETGGSATIEIKANCDWTATCPADWVSIDCASGNLDSKINISVSSSRLSRTTVVTVASNEVESRCVEIRISQKGVKEISSVDLPSASGTQSIMGNSVTLTSSFESLGLEEGDIVYAGFRITGDAYDKDVEAEVSDDRTSFSASINDLTCGNTYKCIAWARINDGEKVSGKEGLFTTERVATDITGVGKVIAGSLASIDGTTATLSSSYTATVTLSDEFDFTAGFIISAEGQDDIEVNADNINYADGTFSADVTGLTKGTEYTAKAWAKLDGKVTEGESSVFATQKMLAAGTYEFTFTSDAWKKLPTSANKCKTDGADKIYTITEDEFTWQICGGFIASGCLRLGSANKIGYYGWAVLPQFSGLTVTKLIVPNDGSGSSGTCCVTIMVSEDNGSTWSEVPGCIGRNIKGNSSMCEFTLPDQKPGSLYKIQNVMGEAGQGNSMSSKITVVVDSPETERNGVQ